MIGKLFHFIFVLFILALLIGVPAGWMITRSYSDPEVHYFYAQKAPEEGTEQEKGEESLRFIVLSDLYNYVFEVGNGEIADQAANTSPDAILICGNMISADAENTDVITSLIKRLVQIAPVYYTYGEQEMKYVSAHTAKDASGTEGAADPLREALEKEGAVVLNEEYANAVIYGVSVRIGGMYNKAYEMTNLRGDVKKSSEILILLTPCEVGKENAREHHLVDDLKNGEDEENAINSVNKGKITALVKIRESRKSMFFGLLVIVVSLLVVGVEITFG